MTGVSSVGSSRSSAQTRSLAAGGSSPKRRGCSRRAGSRRGGSTGAGASRGVGTSSGAGTSGVGVAAGGIGSGTAIAGASGGSGMSGMSMAGAAAGVGSTTSGRSGVTSAAGAGAGSGSGCTPGSGASGSCGVSSTRRSGNESGRGASPVTSPISAPDAVVPIVSKSLRRSPVRISRIHDVHSLIDVSRRCSSRRMRIMAKNDSRTRAALTTPAGRTRRTLSPRLIHSWSTEPASANVARQSAAREMRGDATCSGYAGSWRGAWSQASSTPPNASASAAMAGHSLRSNTLSAVSVSTPAARTPTTVMVGQRRANASVKMPASNRPLPVPSSASANWSALDHSSVPDEKCGLTHCSAPSDTPVPAASNSIQRSKRSRSAASAISPMPASRLVAAAAKTSVRELMLK